ERPELRHVVTHFARAIENAWVATQPHRLLVRLNWPGRAPGHDDDGLVALDADGVLAGTNSAARQMLGTPPDAAHAQDLFALQADLLFDAARRGASLEVPLWSGLRVLACPVLAGAGHAVRQLPAALPTGAGTPLRQIEVDLIRQAVDEAHGNVATAARRLGVSRATVYRKLASLVRGRSRKA
ncbi:MAG: histidine kinase, partial [Betaproteobacteria bacterium]|nr:histidine kinase [Betaproteobacteria bacterium]